MVANINSFTPVLKEVYEGKVRDQLDNEVTTLKRIEKTSTGVSSNIEGKYVTFPVHLTRSNALGSRAEYDYLPEPDRQGYKAVQINLTSAYASIELTGQAIDFSQRDPQAFAKALDEEVTRIKDDARKDLNRQVYGTHVGTISTVSGSPAANATSITVADASRFTRNDKVDMIDISASNAVIRTVVVTGINTSTNTLTVTGDAGTAAGATGDLLVRHGSLNNEIYGLEEIIQSSGTLYNVTDDEWTANVTNVGGALSEGAMVRMADDIRQRGGKTTVIFQSAGVRRAYWNLLSQLRSVVNTQEFKGGFTGLAFTTDNGEIPVVADFDAPTGTQYFVNEDALTLYRESPWNWLDRDGNMWKQVTDGGGVRDAWRAHMVQRHQLGTDRRNTHGKLTNITEA